jgi:hypothetical protein
VPLDTIPQQTHIGIDIIMKASAENEQEYLTDKTENYYETID